MITENNMGNEKWYSKQEVNEQITQDVQTKKCEHSDSETSYNEEDPDMIEYYTCLAQYQKCLDQW